jgi:7-carboxy-7-deazaguanine synthase
VRHNLQPISKQENEDDGSLSIVDVWSTIQGEGPYAGTPATFVRLAGCNLQCPACDTDYTTGAEKVTATRLLQLVNEFHTGIFQPLIVITGGEPFRQNFVPFARAAVYNGYRVQIETNGTLWIDEFYPSRFDVICSPKTPKIHDEIKRYIRALKYVVEAGKVLKEDGLPISVLGNDLIPARPWKGYEGEVYVQPMDSDDKEKNEANTKEAIESCLKFGYRFCLQVHKYIGLQ